MPSERPRAAVVPLGRLAPARLLLATAVVALALVAWLAWLNLQVPWLGLELSPSPDGAGARVERVDPDGPSAGRIAAGAVLRSLAARDGPALPLTAQTLARATYRLPTYEAMDDFVAEHRAIFRALRGGEVVLTTAQGTRVAIAPRPTRPLAALTVDFWAAATIAALALVMCTGVWAFGRRDAAGWLFMLSGFGLAGTMATISIVLGRELTFDPAWATPVWAVNQVSRLLSHWGMLMLFWVYPQPFRPLRRSWPVAAAFVLAGVATALQWWPRPSMAAPLMSTLTVLVGIPLLATWQWRASRGRPLDRAVVKMMVIAIAVPSLVVIVTNQGPNMLWQRPLIESAAVLASINLMAYVGCAVGIARVRLFNLDRWWFEALLWSAGGALVIGLDALLLWLNAAHPVALGLALAIAGWVYFPMRQWLWRRFDPRAARRLEHYLPRLVEQLFRAGSSAELERHWALVLQDVFSPLSVEPVDAAGPPRVLDDGLALQVPALSGAAALKLQHADKGRRLFGDADAALSAELLALALRAVDAAAVRDRHAAEREARLREKELILQDLHDGLGGLATNIRLLAGMAQRDEAPPAVRRTLGTIADLADESLSEIRGFMYSLDEADAGWPALAADLRAFGRKIVEPHGLAFEMSVRLQPPDEPPDSLLRLNLARICKEALLNTVKHAKASRVDVELRVDAGGLRLRIADDGIGLPAALARGAGAAGGRSRGLANLRRRAQQLGGEIAFEPGPGTVLALSLPLPVKSPVPGMAQGSAAG